MPRKPLTAKEALRRVLEGGWRSDALAEDTATQMLVEQGDDPLGARLMVQKEIKRLQIMGAN